MPVQVVPPSVVCTMDVHGFVPHGAVPSSQPSVALTNVRSRATKPLGTGPPFASPAGGLAPPAPSPTSPGDSADAGVAVPAPLCAQPARTRADSSAIAGLYPIRAVLPTLSTG